MEQSIFYADTYIINRDTGMGQSIFYADTYIINRDTGMGQSIFYADTYIINRDTGIGQWKNKLILYRTRVHGITRIVSARRW